MKKLFAIIMVMCLVMGLCACGGGDGDGKTDSTEDANTAKSIAGRYEIFSISFQDQVMNKDELAEMEVNGTTDAVVFNEDGTGTWFLEGDEIAITYDEKTIIDPSSDLNEPYNYEVKDGILSIIVGEDATYSYKLVS